ncbi:MAG TPA: glycoside hydrolase family 57, partial [Elusimicrobia bacterium]|nr:glycoside hydrolase family 57 [Elusimicrobiota bacterium]
MIKLAFLWHQHQPFYKDLSTGQYALPWVRLHATKDYYDMVAILDQFPKIKLNFNLVPSLLVQLEDYARGGATDQFLELTLKPAKELTEDEHIFVLHNFFMVNWDNMIKPYPRYRELLEKRGRHTVLKELKRIQIYFREQDYRDLQVWFNLSWMDSYWKKNDPLVKELFAKGKNFTEEDKIALINKQREICSKIVKKYKEVQE